MPAPNPRLSDGRWKNPAAYAGLLILESVAVVFLIWIVFPIFYSVMTNLGARQEISVQTLFAILAAAIILQASYWTRLIFIAVCVPCRSVFLSHLVGFSARLAFLFGGVLFSTVFFRHMPEAATMPPLGDAILRGSGLMLVLFGFFCYSQELDRMAKAFEDH